MQDRVQLFDATELARATLGDSIFSNMMILGAAWQQGLVPVPHDAIAKAVELNGAAVEKNLRAFEIGRWAMLHPEEAERIVTPNVVEKPKTPEQKIAFREEHLTAYQNKRLARRYRRMLDRIEDPSLREAVAEGYHKLLSYKDEYEVARLHLETRRKASETFEEGFRMNFHLSPPVMSKEGPDGRPVKKQYGEGMLRAFGILAKLKGLRGTPLDPFGRTTERRMERALIAQYERDMDEILPLLTPETTEAAIALARLPLTIRGFGPVKEANEREASKRREELLSVIRQGGAPLTQAAE